MDFSAASPGSKRKEADLLFVPFWKTKKGPENASSVKLPSWNIPEGDFEGKAEEVVLIYGTSIPEKRLVLVGLGEEEHVTVELLRRAFGAALKAVRNKGKTLHVVLPEVSSLSSSDTVKGAIEGILSVNYQFTQYKTNDQDKGKNIHAIVLITAFRGAVELAKREQAIFEGVYLARDLGNGNADDVTPHYLGQIAKGLAKEKHVSVTVHDKKWILAQKMGLLAAVSRASSKEPVFIVAKYEGNPRSKDWSVLVGKGVTYDTGGLNLKPTGSMEDMKCDMGGAAIVLGTLKALSLLQAKVNVAVVIPSTENSIDSSSYKPGDVYTSYLGKTVEITNTDAEGRLILADALAWAEQHLKPTRMIDVATLTGSMMVALGSEATGMMSNNDALADALCIAGAATFERVWRFPLFEEYKENLKSDIADLKNCGPRWAGAINAALFLQEFVGKTPWAHLDVAGTFYIQGMKRYLPAYSTGTGVRLLAELLTKGAG